MVGKAGRSEAAPLPLQVIKGHCRFLYPESVEEMQGITERITSIQEMLRWCKRAA
jgi:hypothetical protein